MRPLMHSWMRPLQRLVFPDMCLSCSTRIEGKQSLCAQCWRDIYFFRKGKPWYIDVDEHHGQIYSVMAYENCAIRLVSRYKYGRRLECVPTFARWMIRAGGAILPSADLLIPVPMHFSKLVRRGFNQVMPIAQNIASTSGVPLLLSAPVRRKHKSRPPQASLPSRHSRIKNVVGAFQMPPEKRRLVDGKHIIVIDDVFTTGATMRAMTSCLKRAGAAQVDALTLARVL